MSMNLNDSVIKTITYMQEQPETYLQFCYDLEEFIYQNGDADENAFECMSALRTVRAIRQDIESIIGHPAQEYSLKPHKK